MSEDNAIRLSGRLTVSDVMVALAKQSIFDLPSLAGEIAKQSQEHAQAENEPEAVDILVHETYVLVHTAEAE